MAVCLSFLLILTGLKGIHSISTISKVSVKAGTSISIPCLYDSQYTNHVKYLCKGYYWSSCSYAIKTNQPSSGRFSISDDKKQRIFTVTIKDVTYQDTDYYWCIVEINGGSDIGAYFHLSVFRDRPSLNVENQQITAFKGGDVTINCSHQNSGEMKWCKLGRNCVTGLSGSIDGTRVSINPKSSHVFTVTMSGLKTESSGWYMCVKGDLQMPVHVTVDKPPTININSISTISKVSVKAGASISIPCLYDTQYTNRVKYLCKGYYWSSCSYAIKTNQPSSRKFSISDDKKQRIFTVTIKDVTYQDNDYYWCAVEINGGSDVGAYFHLSVVRDRPSLNVENQQITAFKGGDVTVNCSHQNSGEMKWCKLGRNCVTGSSKSIDGTRVSINPKSSRVFTVTMSGLKTESSGWYMCVKGDLQMPVHVTVDEQPTTIAPAAGTALLTSVPPTPMNLITGFADKENDTFQDEQHSSSSISTSFICRLSLLVFFLIMSSFILFMVNRHKQTKESSTTTKQQEKVRYVKKTSNEVLSREQCGGN